MIFLVFTFSTWLLHRILLPDSFWSFILAKRLKNPVHFPLNYPSSSFLLEVIIIIACIIIYSSTVKINISAIMTENGGGDLNPVPLQNLEQNLSSLQLQNNIKIHQFRTQILDTAFFFQVTNFGKSVYIWVGDGEGKMNDLAMSSVTPYDKKGMPTTTKIVGSTGDNLSESFAAKLTKKLGKPAYVSINVDLGAMYTTILRDIEQRLYEEIAINPDKF